MDSESSVAVGHCSEPDAVVVVAVRQGARVRLLSDVVALLNNHFLPLLRPVRAGQRAARVAVARYHQYRQQDREDWRQDRRPVWERTGSGDVGLRCRSRRYYNDKTTTTQSTATSKCQYLGNRTKLVTYENGP